MARLTIFSTCSIEIDLRFMLRLTPKLAALRISGRVRRSRRLALEVPELPNTLPQLKSFHTVPLILDLNAKILLASENSITEIRGVGDLPHGLEGLPSLRLLVMDVDHKSSQTWVDALAPSRERGGFSELRELIAPVYFARLDNPTAELTNVRTGRLLPKLLCI